VPKGVAGDGPLGLHQEVVLEHLEARLEQDEQKHQEPTLRAKYALLLWHSPRRHFRFVPLAVNALLEALPLLESIGGDDAFWANHELLERVHAALHLARAHKYRLDDVKREVLRSFFQADIVQPYGFARLNGLAELLLERNYFKTDELTGVENHLWTALEHFRQQAEWFQAARIIEQGLQLSRRANVQAQHDWMDARAANLEAQMRQHLGENNPMAAQSFWQEAVQAYSALKNDAQVQSLKEMYSGIVSAIRLGSVITSIPAAHVQTIEQRGIDAVRLGLPSFMNALAHSNLAVPQKSEAQAQLTPLIAGNSALLHLGVQTLDARGNISKTVGSVGAEAVLLRNAYDGLLQLRVLALHFGLREGVQCEMLSAEEVLLHWKQTSWYGLTQTHTYPDGQTVTYSALDLLEPGIREFFAQLERYCRGEAAEWMLCLDSLTPKVEALLRLLAKAHGVATETVIQDGSNWVTREKDLNTLLYDQALLAHLDEDTVYFLQFLLVEKNGFNLRNDLSHGLLPPSAYSAHFAYWVFLALVRLAVAPYPQTLTS